MSFAPNLAFRRSDFPSCKLIVCLLPDDGTDKRLLDELRNRFDAIRASSSACRAVGAFVDVKTRRGKLPQARLAKRLTLICSEEQADELFDFIFHAAGIGNPGGGLMWQRAVAGATPYHLPKDIPDEKGGD